MALSEEITILRTFQAIEVIHGPQQRLMALLLSMSKNGKERLYAHAIYYWKALKISRATYYRWRRKLLRAGLISVEERRSDQPRQSYTSLISVVPLKEIAKRLWDQLRGRLTNETQTPSFYSGKESNSRAKLKPGRWKPSPTTQWLVRQGLRHNRC